MPETRAPKPASRNPKPGPCELSNATELCARKLLAGPCEKVPSHSQSYTRAPKPETPTLRAERNHAGVQPALAPERRAVSSLSVAHPQPKPSGVSHHQYTLNPKLDTPQRFGALGAGAGQGSVSLCRPTLNAQPETQNHRNPEPSTAPPPPNPEPCTLNPALWTLNPAP